MDTSTQVKNGLKIVLLDGTEIKAQDTFDSDEAAIEQMTRYGTTGYYSRARRVYFPPYQIKSIHMITMC